MPVGDFNPAYKPKHKRGGLTQKQMGDISTKVDKQLKERSHNVCEVRKRCVGAPAAERAHTIGRRLIAHPTTVDDLFHACKLCHLWLDEDPEGIRFKRYVRDIGTTQYLRERGKNADSHTKANILFD